MPEAATPAERPPFLTDPHPTLYPCVFEGSQPRADARDRIVGHVLPVIRSGIPPAADHVRFCLVGSGASYNWDEDGDLDVQVWVDVDAFATSGAAEPPEGLVKALRVHVNTVNHVPVADLGLANEACAGAMRVQYFVKGGRGSREDVLAERPYAAYDLDAGVWIVEPRPITPEFYADLFLAVETRAREIADEADDVLSDLQRSVREAAYWAELAERRDEVRYAEQAEEARVAAERAHAAVTRLFEVVAEARQAAYSPHGRGIADPRDALTKMLEVWDVFDRLKAAARAPLPWRSDANG